MVVTGWSADSAICTSKGRVCRLCSALVRTWRPGTGLPACIGPPTVQMRWADGGVHGLTG